MGHVTELNQHKWKLLKQEWKLLKQEPERGKKHPFPMFSYVYLPLSSSTAFAFETTILLTTLSTAYSHTILVPFHYENHKGIVRK